MSISHISRSYGTVNVLDNLSLDFCLGEIHSIVGENGAGKTTLVHIISGLVKPDNGEIRVSGRNWSSLTYQTALKMGILIVRQDLVMPERSSLAEYIFLGREPGPPGLVDYREMEVRTMRILERLELDLSPSTTVGKLNLAEKRMIAIARAVSLSPKILILDEATNFFSSAEEEKFLRLIRILRDEGMCIIHISHKLDEVLKISDRITILREGRLVLTSPSALLNRDDIITQMVGRNHTHIYYWIPHYPSGETLLQVTSLNLGKRLTDINFSLKEGEVLGLAGLVGSGRTTLGRILFGLERADSGSIRMKGKSLKINRPFDALNAGIAYISDDRHKYGILERQSLGFNLTINILSKISRFFRVIKKRERSAISDAMEKFVLRRYLPDQTVATLSGGTQQKVAFARSTGEMPDLLIVDEPTREIDIEGQKELYTIINNLAAEKVGVILISSILGDLINNCDRILVLKSGRIVKELRKTEFNEEMIMHYAIDSHLAGTAQRGLNP